MTIRIAFKALARNKLRTLLTMLGMIIGVAAVITMVALGTGAQSSIDAQIQTMGTNTIQVMSGNFTQGGVRQGQGNASTLTPEDANAIREVPGVLYAAASQNTRGQMIAGNLNWNTQLEGTDVDYPLINAWQVEQGNFFTPQDVTTAAKVLVIGAVVRDQLFGADANPVGLLVDRVTSVVRLERESVEAKPRGIRRDMEVLEGIGRVGDRMLIVLDVPALLNSLDSAS